MIKSWMFCSQIWKLSKCESHDEQKQLMFTVRTARWKVVKLCDEESGGFDCEVWQCNKSREDYREIWIVNLLNFHTNDSHFRGENIFICRNFKKTFISTFIIRSKPNKSESKSNQPKFVRNQLAAEKSQLHCYYPLEPYFLSGSDRNISIAHRLEFEKTRQYIAQFSKAFNRFLKSINLWLYPGFATRRPIKLMSKQVPINYQNYFDTFN